MKYLILFLVSFNVFAQNNGYFSNQEVIQQQKEKSRQENALINDALKPNEPSKNTPVNIHIDSDATFDINNHLLGYSKIFEGDKELSGVKITGALNVAFYKVSNSKKSIRLVSGIELPVMDISNRTSLFAGGGFQFGDDTTIYLSSGMDIMLLSWIKAQVGLNYGIGKNLGPMINIGLTW